MGSLICLQSPLHLSSREGSGRALARRSDGGPGLSLPFGDGLFTKHIWEVGQRLAVSPEQIQQFEACGSILSRAVFLLSAPVLRVRNAAQEDGVIMIKGAMKAPAR